MRLGRLSLPLLVLLTACSDPGHTTAQPALPLAEPNRAPPPNVTTMKMSFAPIVRRAAPAVVNVYSTRTVRAQVDPFFQLFGGGMGVPQARREASLGSGAIVRSDGVVVTNNHVIEGGTELRVVLADRREFPAHVLLADARADVAVLKIDLSRGESLPVLPIADREDVQVGDLVLAIGDPFGVGQTVTNGIVSGLARTDLAATDFNYYIQTDAAINPGNSGGPLVDMSGNMIGLNTFILSRSGSSSGVGFAIPAALVKRVIDSALGGAQRVQRPWLGLKTQTVDAETARSLGLDRPQGVLVADVYPGGPGARAGLAQGDVVLSVDGQAVNDEGGLNYRVATHKPGERIRLQVRRSGSVREASLPLEPPPADPPRDERTLSGRQPMAGATVVNLSPAVADQFGLDPFVRGVLVTKAGQDVAARAGFRPGDIIRAVNGRPVNNTSALTAALSTGAGQGGWQIAIQRGGQVINAEFGL